MESFVNSLFEAIGWFVSGIIKGRIKGWMILFVFLPMIVLSIIGWFYLQNKNKVDWLKVPCQYLTVDNGEKAVKIVHASPKLVQFQTNKERIMEFSLIPRYKVEPACSIIRNSQVKGKYYPTLGCEGIIEFKVASRPENIIDQATIEECGYAQMVTTESYSHTDFVILEDGSVWYWDKRYFSRDTHNISILIIMAAFGFLLGVGAIWGYFVLEKERLSWSSAKTKTYDQNQEGYLQPENPDQIRSWGKKVYRCPTCSKLNHMSDGYCSEQNTGGS